jgi:hypothetical protein
MIGQEVIYNYLKANSGVAAKVSTRIHYLQAPQESVAPYLVLTTIGLTDLSTLQEPSKLSIHQIQIMVVADDVLAMVDTMQAVHTAMSLWPITATVSSVSYTINAAVRESQNDFFDNDTKQYYTVARYNLYYSA